MEIIIHWFISALAIIATAYLLPGVTVAGFGSALITALVLGILNALLKPILVLLTLPVNILTLGLFSLVINAVVIMLVANIVDGFKVDNFWIALIFSVILAVISSLIGSMFTD